MVPYEFCENSISSFKVKNYFWLASSGDEYVLHFKHY